jgi:tRNA modification GTPase
MQTIFALATARGKAGVAIVRISGPDAARIAEILCGAAPVVSRPALRKISSASGDVLDHGLVLYFKAPHSFTGEDVVEFQIHGSPAVVRAVEAAVQATGLARLADPGEFTLRALLNDRMDVAQVEGLADLIEAETEAQRKQAMRVFSGELTEKTAIWRENLLRAAALLEASIDFADEDVPVDVMPEVVGLLETLKTTLVAEIAGSKVAERVRDGFEVAILGAPNAGKSTLLNALAGRDIAITSEVAGTTRDVIEARMDIAGLAVTFLDTAGLRDVDDQVERIGVDRAITRAREADLRIALVTEDWEEPKDLVGMIDLSYLAKADLTDRGGVSGKTGAGIDRLLSDVTAAFEDRVAVVRTAITARQRDGMLRALATLDEAIALAESSGEMELIAECLRSSIRALDSLVGRVDVEAVLGEIFSRFCIGK